MPSGLDGISFAPTLRGQPASQPTHEYLYWEYARKRQAVRMGRWKAYRPHPSKPIQLYDLEADPAESTDVSAEHPEVLLQIETLLRTARTPSEHFPLVKD